MANISCICFKRYAAYTHWINNNLNKIICIDNLIWMFQKPCKYLPLTHKTRRMSIHIGEKRINLTYQFEAPRWLGRVEYIQCMFIAVATHGEHYIITIPWNTYVLYTHMNAMHYLYILYRGLAYEVHLDILCLALTKTRIRRALKYATDYE